MDSLEYHESVELANYLEDLKREGKILRYTHIPNETWTKSWNQKMRNVRQGVKKGFPDYIILFPDRAIFIEMKRVKGGVVSPEQKEWIADLQRLGFRAEICKGFLEAKALIEYYL